LNGRRVVVFLAVGLSLVTAAILIGFLFFSPDVQACANGEDAKNPESQPGVTLPLERQFGTIAEAERFICHSIEYPRDEGLTLERVSAFRSGSLQQVVEGDANAEVRLEYKIAPSGRLLQLNVSPQDLGPPKASPQSQMLRVQGQEAVLTRGGPSPDYVQVDWRKNGLSFHAQSQLSDGFTQEGLLAVLNSVR
jgi:hypothetical protein